MKSLDKNKTKKIIMINIGPQAKPFIPKSYKTKELDWDTFLEQMGWEEPNTFTLEKERVKSLLQKQRTELLEDIKKIELKHSINPNSPSRERKIIYNEAIKDVIRLLNKKDE